MNHHATHHATQLLLDEMEEYYSSFEHFPLYHLVWTLRGQTALAPGDMHEVARGAFDEFRRRHRVRLVWSRWPIDLETSWSVEPDVQLDFDLDPDGDPSEPLLVLVPDPGDAEPTD